jgi:hypothetical protein
MEGFAQLKKEVKSKMEIVSYDYKRGFDTTQIIQGHAWYDIGTSDWMKKYGYFIINTVSEENDDISIDVFERGGNTEEDFPLFLCCLNCGSNIEMVVVKDVISLFRLLNEFSF